MVTGRRPPLLEVVDILTTVTNIETVVTNVQTMAGRVLCEFVTPWSAYQLTITLGAAQLTIALPNIIVAGIPAGATVTKALIDVKCRTIENSNAAVNNLNGATVAATSQVIQVQNSVGGTWTDCINFIDNQFEIGISSVEGGDLMGGQINVSGEVDGNGTYNLRWLLSRADLNSLIFHDVQARSIITYSL